MYIEFRVPFSQFRPGSVIEFEVFPGKPWKGTVAYLASHGPRNIHAVLSRLVEHDGTVHEGTRKHTNTPPVINITYATRVLMHGVGEAVFDEQVDAGLLRAVANIRKSSGYKRHGKRLILTDAGTYPLAAFRMLLDEHILLSAKTLGIRPWEFVDTDAMADATLGRAGIVKAMYEQPDDDWPHTVIVRVEKLKRFVSQNINRFKSSLDALSRIDDQDVEMELLYYNSPRGGSVLRNGEGFILADPCEPFNQDWQPAIELK